jgi:hypothetical protein
MGTAWRRRVKEIRTLCAGDVAGAADLLAASDDPIASLGRAFAVSLLRTARRQRRTVALVAGRPGRIEGVCVVTAAPRPLIRAALRDRPTAPLAAVRHEPRRTALALARMADGSSHLGAVVALAAGARSVDGVLAAALAELDDHDVTEVAILAGSRTAVLERSGFAPVPGVGPMPTMRWR